MNWRIIPALAYILLLNIVVSCIDDLFASPDNAEEITVICNHSVKTDSLSRDTIREIFLGRKTRWDDGGKIILATLKEGKVHEFFLEEYVGDTPRQFLDYWTRLAFTGMGRVPNTFASPREMIEYVKNAPGCIGYVPSSEYRFQVKSIAME